MALLPPIPPKPAERPESRDEYLRRRPIVIRHRQFNEQLVMMLRRYGDRALWGGIDYQTTSSFVLDK